MNHDPITRWAALVAVVLLVFILGWALLASARRPSFDERMNDIESQLSFVSCMLLIPIEDRTPSATAECQLGETP